MKPLSWLKDWLDRPSDYLDDGWLDQANAEMKRDSEEWILKGIREEREKKLEREALRIMRDIYGDKS
ncbi:Srh transcription modulator [Escherichia phage IME08]|uniref:Srh transcription modulator n=1 Tax=Escherichia phage IME08 TaxID=698728 RepID=D7RM34_9CAUD|nr:decoy of host sigma32 [Escherichia phage IME08]ADI55350.1 Srh transcription modulator [Escherichia phage IME08]